MCENLNFENCHRSQKAPWLSTKQSLDSPHEVFLTGESNTNNKKQLPSISSSRFQPFEEKNEDFFDYFFVRVPIFDPTGTILQ